MRVVRMHRGVRRLLLAGAVGPALALGGGSLAGVGSPVAGAATGGGRCGGALTLSVQGAGTVSGAPNLLTITFDLSSTASSAAGALTANDAATAAVVAALKSGGVLTADLQTIDLSIQPQYAPTSTTVTGYEVDDTVVAKLRDLTTAGSVIGAAVTAGGDAVRVDNLTYSVTNPTSLEDRARSLAVHRASGHASAIAAAAGERLGRICSLTDETSTGTTGTHRIFEPVAGSAASSPNVPATVPVQQGSDTETDQVKIVYALAPAVKRH